MKKNVMLKIASVLMVAVLLTTCAISSTFAKYVTISKGSDSARIAKFGITSETIVDGFDTTYVTDDENVVATIANSVASSDTDNLLAPGTTKTVAVDVKVTGTAEVAVNVKTEFVFSYEGFTDEYFPIYFTTATKTYKHISIGGTYDTIAALLADVSADCKIDNNFAANTPITDDDAEVDSEFVTWTWDYEKSGDVDTNGDGINDYDEKDVALSKTNYELKLDVKTTITQID